MTEPHTIPRHGAVRVRRRRGVRRSLLIALALVVAVVLVVAAVVWARLSAFNDRVSDSPAVSTALFGPLVFGDDRVEILVLGYGGPQHEGAYLTDSINVLSIDPATDQTTIVPVPRDLWVEGRPEIPGNGKINQAFSIGNAAGGVTAGAELASAVVGAVTGLEVDHWMTLDFGGLEAAVDAVGGVTVENPTSFAYGSPADVESGSDWDGTFEAGQLDLDGASALLYARTRYTSDPGQSNDFARSVRQQRVLQALVRKVSGEGVGSLGAALSAMDAIGDHLRTDLSVIDLALLAGNMDPDHRVELAEGVILEATTTTDGQYVLVPIGRAGPTDYRPIHEYLAEELAKPIPTATQSVSP